MSTLTKAAALRWLDSHVGEDLDTVQVRPDGLTWQPGQRTLVKAGARTFRLDGSTVRLTANHVVLELDDEHLRLELLDDDGVTIRWTTYTVPRPDDDDDDDDDDDGMSEDSVDPRYAHLDDATEREWLTKVSPADVARNAHRIYDFMEESGIPADSYTREMAFEKAAAALGVDYDVLYDAWLAETPMQHGG